MKTIFGDLGYFLASKASFFYPHFVQILSEICAVLCGFIARFRKVYADKIAAFIGINKKCYRDKIDASVGMKVIMEAD